MVTEAQKIFLQNVGVGFIGAILIFVSKYMKSDVFVLLRDGTIALLDFLFKYISGQ